MAALHLVRVRLSRFGLLPRSKLALFTWYLFGLDIFLFVLQKLSGVFSSVFGQSLGVWVSGLSLSVIVLFAILAMRWAKAKLLWRLRNRLIVTYVFIGVIPVILLVALALGSFYLFAGQFATFIVTTRLDAELTSLETSTSATANNMAAQLRLRTSSPIASFPTEEDSANRQLYAWLDEGRMLGGALSTDVPPPLPTQLKLPFHGLVRDHQKLFLRVVKQIAVGNRTLTVFANEPLDQRLLESLASNLGEVALYTSGITLTQVSGREYVLNTSKDLTPSARAGTAPPAAGRFDTQVTFPTALPVVNWDTGVYGNLAAISVQTRLSTLYERLFASLGTFAPAVEFSLLLVALVFAVIELIALLIGIRLNRTMTGSVDKLYAATLHINRGDFSHRIPVHSTDQLATLAGSFNSMTAFLEKLIVEQKEKQRMENELAIAQEVQAQLFPRHISQLSTLEVFGFCRPARSVSGDYYDFLAMGADRLLLAVGDVSGKGISAALLMATIHSAVRAYSLEGVPVAREAMMVGGSSSASNALLESTLQAMTLRGLEVSPAAMLTLLNHQLYASTPAEKYATLFLGMYDGERRTLTYSNGGHLPPIILRGDQTIRRLDQGGTVVGLFDQKSYDEASVRLNRGEIFLAYSDGVTEPENDFGEFGEQRLIELVRENRELPLPKISELVTAAVDDWIGDAEQPDDVTLVLARSR
jgi:sigma-B regulation protein RsbU (phosphoserine phosphatase)